MPQLPRLENNDREDHPMHIALISRTAMVSISNEHSSVSAI